MTRAHSTWLSSGGRGVGRGWTVFLPFVYSPPPSLGVLYIVQLGMRVLSTYSYRDVDFIGA